MTDVRLADEVRIVQPDRSVSITGDTGTSNSWSIARNHKNLTGTVKVRYIAPEHMRFRHCNSVVVKDWSSFSTFLTAEFRRTER